MKIKTITLICTTLIMAALSLTSFAGSNADTKMHYGPPVNNNLMKSAAVGSSRCISFSITNDTFDYYNIRIEQNGPVPVEFMLIEPYGSPYSMISINCPWWPINIYGYNRRNGSTFWRILNPRYPDYDNPNIMISNYLSK